MRLPLATLEVFTAIAREGSLRGAAERLGIKPSTVSHQLKTLENQLGTALFIRTTRSVQLTEAGRALMRGADPAFTQLADAVEAARTTGHMAQGRLKLALPEFVYDLVIGPMIPSFSKAYPKIELELSITDALADILDEGLHAGFRLGDRISQDMIAIRVTPPLKLAVVVSPVVAVNSAPVTPSDLLACNCIRYRFPSSGQIAPWKFSGADGDYTVDIAGPVIVNSLPASFDLARRGQGFAYTFRNYVQPDIAARRLVTVLDDHLPETPGVFLYFPREYRSMVPLRLLIDHLRAAWAGVNDYSAAGRSRAIRR